MAFFALPFGGRLPARIVQQGNPYADPRIQLVFEARLFYFAHPLTKYTEIAALSFCSLLKV